MRLVQLLSSVILLIATSSVPADQPAGATKAKQQRRGHMRQAAEVLKVLDKSVPGVDWDAEPFEDLLNEEFKTRFGLKNIVVDWKVIENSAADVDPDTEVTLNLQDLTVGELLDLVLEQVSAGALTRQERLTYHVDGGIVRISTRQEFDRRLVTRSYMVEHLLQAKPMWKDAPVVSVDGQNQGGENGGPIFEPGAGGEGVDFEKSREQKLQGLIDLIKTQVRPGTWDRDGKGRIAPFGDKLVITQTLEAHEMIGGFVSGRLTLRP